jgi:cell division protein FtsB
MTSSDKEKLKALKSGFARFNGVYLVRGLAGVLLFVNLLLLYGIFLSPRGILGYQRQCRQVEEMENKILKIRKENQKLFSKIQTFKADPRKRERQVREQLGWARENELVFEFPPLKSEAEK